MMMQKQGCLIYQSQVVKISLGVADHAIFLELLNLNAYD